MTTTYYFYKFVNQFGGYVLYSDKSTEQVYIGVTTVRLVSRFRRLAREGGIDYRLRKELPATFKLGGSLGGKRDWIHFNVGLRSA